MSDPSSYLVLDSKDAVLIFFLYWADISPRARRWLFKDGDSCQF